MKLIAMTMLLSALFFSSCFSPKKIVHVSAEESQTFEWNYGRQVVTVRDDSMEAKIFFDRYTKDYLIFDVEIINYSNETVLVSPEDFYLEPIPGGGGAWHALNPEVEILGTQIKESQREAANKNSAVAVGAALVAAVVATAIISSDDNDANDDYVNYAPFAYIDVSPVVPPTPLTVLPPEQRFWEDFSLRKTTVPRGYKVSGKVVFPRIDVAGALLIYLPVGRALLKSKFQQHIILP